MATRAVASPPRADLRRIAIIAGLALTAMLLLWHLAHLTGYIVEALRYPFQLDYGEGIVWQQMRDIMGGTGYAPLHTYPAIVYHYPPVYHAASWTLAALTGMDELYAGRLASILSSLASAWMVGALTVRLLPSTDGRFVRLACALLAGLLFLSCYPVRMWTPLMRVDMLAGAFGLAGMLMAMRALSRPGWIYGAGLMFALAMFTKQISVAAPAAAFGILLWVQPRLAIRGVIFAACVSLAGLGAMVWATDGGFLRHVVGYNVNRIDLAILTGILMPQLVMHAALIGLGLVGGGMAWRALRTGPQPQAAAAAMLLLFVALKTVMLLGMLKSGSGYNYMIEWLSGVAALAGLAFAPWLRLAHGQDRGGRGGALLAPLLVFLLLPAQLVALHLGLPDHRVLPALAIQRQPIADAIAASARPVIADDMTFLIRGGRPVRWESAITAELGAKGVYDQRGFARLVRARCFGFFVIEGKAGQSPFIQRYNPVVAAAIATAYPRESIVGKYVLHRPDGPADSATCAGVR